MMKVEENKERGKLIIATMIELAKKLKIPALAKSVETNEQLAFLRSIDCNLAQGYLFGRPAPMNEF